jgi:hypothetical protein
MGIPSLESVSAYPNRLVSAYKNTKNIRNSKFFQEKVLRIKKFILPLHPISEESPSVMAG